MANNLVKAGCFFMEDFRYKKRCLILGIFFTSLFLGLLLWKILQYQYYSSHELSTYARNQYSYEEKTSDIKYELLDTNGNNLINFKEKYYAVIEPFIFFKYNVFSENEDLLKISYILKNYNQDYNLPSIKTSDTDKKMYYEIDLSTFNKLCNISDVKGFYVYKANLVDRSEAWSIENLLTNTKKTDGSGYKDSSSLEMYINNSTKNNQYPEIVFRTDNEERIVSKQEVVSDKNINIKTTLDKNIQDSIKSLLNSDKYKKFTGIGAILMESDTGDIKAFVQKNDSLPNVNIGAATEDGYQPGSIFKVLVEEAGLEKNKIKVTDNFNCKYYKNSKDSLCKEDHGTLSVAEALTVSCNNIFAQIGEKVGADNFISLAKQEGLFSKVLNLQDEVTGDYVTPDPGKGGSKLISIGQNMRITPIQAISIANTVENNGIYVKPRIIDSLVDSNGKEISTFTREQKNVISQDTANKLKEQMYNVVTDGTAKDAFLNDIKIGGKTGTTQRNDGGKMCSDGWFVGFFSIKNKNYSMVVYVKDIDLENEGGGSTAVPIFKDIAELLKNRNY